MIGRVFDSNRAPTDPKLWSCAYCGCDSVIFIEEDDECEERNDAKTSQYVVLDKIWNKYLAEADHAANASLPKPDWPLNPFKANRPMKRAPAEPKGDKIESQRVLCTCVNNLNINPGLADAFNGCIAKCRKRADSNDECHMVHLALDPNLECFEWEGTP